MYASCIGACCTSRFKRTSFIVELIVGVDNVVPLNWASGIEVRPCSKIEETVYTIINISGIK